MISLDGLPSCSSRLKAAILYADQAGALTLQHFQQGVAVDRKADDSPVTVADRGAEQLLRQLIREQFPDDAIIGEEFGETRGDSGYRWILDPIDGTKSFITGVPLYSVLLGIEHGGTSIAGVIHVPGLGETVVGERENGAWYLRTGKPAVRARVSERTSLRDGVFLTSQVDGFQKRRAAQAYQQLEARSYITRTWGDAYGYLLVATGRAEVMVDPLMNVWDAAALAPILDEAGGTFTDWQGNRTIYGGEGIATNGHVLEEVLAITRAFPRPA